MNAERAAFMAALGITEEDVIDPDHHITSNTSKPSGRSIYKSHLTPDVNEKQHSTGITHDIECANIPGKVPVHNSTHAISLSSSCSNGLSLSQLSSPKTTQTSFQMVNDSLHNTNYTYNYNTKQNTPTFNNTFNTNTSNNHVPAAAAVAENDKNRSLHAQHKIPLINQVNKYETNLLPLTLTFHADMRAAEEMKQAGNVAFEVGDFLHSIRHYSHAIDTLTIYAETLLAPPPSELSNTQNILDGSLNKKYDVNFYSSMPTNVHSAHNVYCANAE